MTELEAKEILKNVSIKRKNTFYSLKEISEAREIAVNDIEEILQYRTLGSVKELRLVIGKEIAIKPKALFPSSLRGYECKNCGNKLSVNRFNGKYCHWCGQKLYWDGEE